MDTIMEIEIVADREPGSYSARVLRSVGGGEPSATITLDVDGIVDRRPVLEANVLSSAVLARRVMSETEAAVQSVGRTLFEATFTGDIEAAYRTSTAVAAERGRGVQIALRLTAPELAALPWEALYDPETGTYLCRREPLVRHVPAPHSPTTLAITTPLKVLAMIASPRGLPALDVELERERLEAALRPHLDSGRVELHWLEDVTWAALHQELLEHEWHVLHFVGHGGYDTDTDEGVLAFVGDNGRVDYVTASALADLLDEAEPTPRLVLLNSCESGAASASDLFSGTAAALAHSGIHAVAAMQFAISDAAAIAFARGFYTALATGRGIDEAVRSGRIGILGVGRGTLEWVTPVLYLRGDATRLFDVSNEPPRARVEPPRARVDAAAADTTTDAAPAAPPPTLAPATKSERAAPAPTSANLQPTPLAQKTPPVSGDRRPVPASTSAAAATRSSAEHQTTLAAPRAEPPAVARVAPPQTRSAPVAASKPQRARRSGRSTIVLMSIAVLLVGGIIGVLAMWFGRGAESDSAVPNATPPNPSSADVLIDAATAVTVEVPMNAVSTPTGVRCAPGDRVPITVTGRGFHEEPGTSGVSEVGPDGIQPSSGYEISEYAVWRLDAAKDLPTASVIASIDGTPPYQYVGTGTTFVCDLSGEIHLGVNDTSLQNNLDGFSATIGTPD